MDSTLAVRCLLTGFGRLKPECQRDKATGATQHSDTGLRWSLEHRRML